MKKFAIFLQMVLAVACSTPPLAIDKEKISKEAIRIAEQWNEAWNGEIDLDHMMSLHHPDLQYYWHGKPMSFEGFKTVLEKFVIGVENYNNEIINPVVTVLDENNAIVGFQMIEKGADPKTAENAFTLVITRKGPDWKIIHIHEG